MKRKKIVLSGVAVLLAASYFLASKIVYKTYDIDSKTRVEIEKAVSLYLMDNEDLPYDAARDIKIEFDKSSNFYVATISFENANKKAHVFISKDIEVVSSNFKDE